ncbi:twin-arginine translocase subunit TatC [Desulfovibrio sp. 86]|uniref:Sec-independent protein translocase protein TatC n=2 Tax=Desulfovibrio TaxID=872 RepID=A0A212L0W3_9BACT|nr:twin-arginine translocase subunit TatC [Desulfovibrio sp. 86]SCM71168.1 Sec-independent protein translocase protein TatC [uncultured Desulfovibrio sp.]VZH32778.1 Sec-independent protein translocase protein TatC [Desulfovibrio sp. 86]
MIDEKKAPLEQAAIDAKAADSPESGQESDASAALSVIGQIDLEAVSKLAASATPSAPPTPSGDAGNAAAPSVTAGAAAGEVTDAAASAAAGATAGEVTAVAASAVTDAAANATAIPTPDAANAAADDAPEKTFAATQQDAAAPEAAADSLAEHNASEPAAAAPEATPPTEATPATAASGGQPPLPPASPFPPAGTSGDAPLPVASGGNLPATPDDDDDDDEPDKAMGLMDHLGELRMRIVRCCIAIILGFFACWAVVDPIFNALVNPLLAVLPKGSHAIYTTLPEGFFTRMYIALVAGIFASSPVIFYQIWSFIAPGLYEEEKKYIIPIAVMSALFFASGGAFCYFVVFPYAFSFFVSFATEDIVAMPKVSDYLSFVLKLILAFGIIFEMPLFAFFLARMGVITGAMMRKARRYAILGIFVVAAILTPPDVVSQLLMACPMLVLYEISILVAAAFGRKPKKSEDEESEGQEKQTAAGGTTDASKDAKAARTSEES